MFLKKAFHNYRIIYTQILKQILKKVSFGFPKYIVVGRGVWEVEKGLTFILFHLISFIYLALKNLLSVLNTVNNNGLCEYAWSLLQ